MKEKMEKPEIEEIRFEENNDVVTASITASGESASGFEP